jgi:non-ribosomal peptide synthetase component F
MSEHNRIHRARIEALHPYTPFADEDVEQSIPERFERQVLAHPDRPAIDSPERSFTYDRLNRAANGSREPILSRRCGNADAVRAAARSRGERAGGDARGAESGQGLPGAGSGVSTRSLTYMLADSGAGVVITDTKNLPLATRLAGDKLLAVNVDELDANLSDDNLEVYPSPVALAMLVYTSGSTGNPKGVMHSHRNVLVEVRNLTNEWGIGPYDRWLLYTSLSFANSVRTIYCALLNGGAIYPYDLKRKGFGELPDWLRSHRITIFRTLPTTFRNFMATLLRMRCFRTSACCRLAVSPCIEAMSMLSTSTSRLPA